MAKILFGNIAGDARGSTGAITFSRNRNGAYARQKVSPVQPRTPIVTAKRNLLAALAKTWRTLTDGQRAGWGTIGNTIVRTDTLGQTYTLSGFQAFVAYSNGQSNVSILNGGGVTITENPIPLASYSTLSGLTLTPDISSNNMDLAYTEDDPAASCDYVVFATQPMSPGRKFVPKSMFKQVATFFSNTASPFNVATGWGAIFGPVNQYQAGQVIEVLLQPYDTNGWARTPVRVRGVIQA